jgi:hypothetical protein
MMLIRITGSQLDAKSPEGPISGDREGNLCDFFDSRLVRAVPRVAVVRERGSLRVCGYDRMGRHSIRDSLLGVGFCNALPRTAGRVPAGPRSARRASL